MNVFEGSEDWGVQYLFSTKERKQFHAAVVKLSTAAFADDEISFEYGLGSPLNGAVGRMLVKLTTESGVVGYRIVFDEDMLVVKVKDHPGQEGAARLFQCVINKGMGL